MEITLPLRLNGQVKGAITDPLGAIPSTIVLEKPIALSSAPYKTAYTDIGPYGATPGFCSTTVNEELVSSSKYFLSFSIYERKGKVYMLTDPVPCRIGNKNRSRNLWVF